MKKNLLAAGLLAWSFCVSFLGTAQTVYYVSPNGLDTYEGTEAAPFKTLAKAISVTVNNSNTIIYLRGGEHNYSARVVIANTKNGTAINRLRIFAYPGDSRPVLNFSSMGFGSSNHGIQLKAAYWHLKGFDIYGAGDNGLKIEGGSNNIIENCAFYENQDTGLQIDNGASNNQIINCDSYFNKDPSDGNADGFACKLQAGTGNSFKGCRAWQNSDDGWDGLLTAPNDDISTTYDSCWCFLNGYLKNGAVSAGNGNGFKMGGNQLRHNAKLTFCLSVYNRVKGFDQNNDIGDMILYNCTGYGNKPNFGMNNYDPAAGKVMEIRNSISFAGKSSDAFRSVAVRSNNSWQSPFVTTIDDFISVDTSELRGPRKPDGSLPDINFMHLAPGSDLIDGGINVGLPFVNTAPDLGAFETQQTLPVKLTSFSAANKNKDVLLQWVLATEANNRGWDIERAVSGSNSWSSLGFVAGAGNSNTISNYTFLDKEPAAGTYFYRLKQTDLDGKIAYSSVLLVTIGKKSVALALAVFPNPFKSGSTIRFNVPQFARVSVTVYSEAGQLLKTITNGMLEAGDYQQLFTGTELASGRYIVKLQVANEWVTSYIIKM